MFEPDVFMEELGDAIKDSLDRVVKADSSDERLLESTVLLNLSKSIGVFFNAIDMLEGSYDESDLSDDDDDDDDDGLPF